MNKQKYTLVILGILVFSAGLYALLYFTIIQPKMDENKQLEKEISMYSAAIEQFSEEESNHHQLEDLAKLLVSIPADKEPNMVLASVNKLASKAKVTVTYIASIEGEEDAEQSLNEAKYTVEIAGANLSQINNFLDSIPQSERLMTVDTLEINQRGTTVSALMNITTYYTKR